MFKHYHSQLTKVLNRSFPIIENPKTKAVYVFAFGLFISAFILVFKPFGFNTLSADLFYHLSLAYGVNSSVALAIVSFIFPTVFKDYFSKSTWNIGKQVCFLFVFFVIFTFSNWILFYYYEIRNKTGFSASYIIGVSLSLDVTPSLLYILIIERQHLKSFQNKEPKVKSTDRTKIIKDIEFCSSNKLSKFEFNSEQICCIKGCGNYFIIYYQSNRSLQQQIVRNTLKSAEEKLSTQLFMRCHKSYIINTHKIERLKGNVKNMKVYISGLDYEIPVSRSLDKEHFNRMKAMVKDL